MTTASFTTTATRAGFTPSWAKRPATVVPSGTSRSSPLSRRSTRGMYAILPTSVKG